VSKAQNRHLIEKLAERFRVLGAQQPENWARSEVEEGIPQLARFLFLRQAWTQIVSESDPSWIARTIACFRETPTVPFSGIGRAVESLRAKGATTDELTDLVRGMQALLLFELCYQLDDPRITEPEGRDIAWGLFQLNKDGEPIAPVTGLHESVLETDPTGLEMRPRMDRY